MSYSKVIAVFMVSTKKKTNYRDAFFNYYGIDYFVSYGLFTLKLTGSHWDLH